MKRKLEIRRENMGFLKWLLSQYKQYKIEKIFSSNKDKASKEKQFKNLFLQCREYGFSEGQILYILNLVSSSEGK